MDYGLTREELRVLRPLSTPRKIQEYLDALPMNFEPEGDTCLSPRRVLREQRAHCIEGAMLAALALRLHGWLPLLVDMAATDFDDDHVIAVFQLRSHWGAISKTNHGVLRYREPIYRSIRELVMSFFHEYSISDGRKTLRSYSDPVDLSALDERGWMTSGENLWFVPEYLNAAPHHSILTRAQIAGLRRADAIERKIGALVEWKPPARAR
ncbi:hypothetical protein COU80_02010 [Candidatus Peregrinibacteria bacterium CG10_big_fil_rev_8_21_14_0_10_55_24]|nr:MAG: hypothetical protein COU80_02010 [Candidatus Peregrinibacteria bacterium CG10_big_fil_rev_8_21_14_0_10_55_24]